MKRFEIIRKTFFQLTVIGIIFIINLAIYVVIPINLTIFKSLTVVSLNGSNFTVQTSVCVLQTLTFYRLISYTYLIESSFIPFVFMFFATILTIRTLFVSRNRIETMENREMKNRRAKDMKFAINSIILDALFVILLIPICLTYLIDIPDQLTYYNFYLTTVVLYYLNYGMPFFVYVFSNSIFRREILKILGFRRYTGQTTVITRIDTKAH